MKNCENCINCDLYENQTSSENYFCTLKEEFINDIEQHFCDDFKII